MSVMANRLIQKKFKRHNTPQVLGILLVYFLRSVSEAVEVGENR